MSDTRTDLMHQCQYIREQLLRFTDRTLIYNPEEGTFQPNDGTIEGGSMRDYFEDCDIRLITDLGGRLLGTRITVAYGGPNIYVDSLKEIVEGWWGLDHIEFGLPSEICQMIDETIEGMRY